MSEDTPVRSEVTSSIEDSKSLTPSILRVAPSDIMIDTSSPSSSFNTSGLVTPQKVIQRAQTTPETLKELLHESEYITTEDDLRKVNAQLKSHILTQGDIVAQKEEEVFKVKAEYSSLLAENKRLEIEIEKLKRLINDTERNLDYKTQEYHDLNDLFMSEKKNLEKKVKELERENAKLKELVKGESVEFFKSELQEKIKVIGKIKELEDLVSELDGDRHAPRTSFLVKEKLLRPVPKENSEIVIKMDELVKKLIEQKEKLIDEKENMEKKLEALLDDKHQEENELYQRLEKLVDELNEYKSKNESKQVADFSVMTEKHHKVNPELSVQVELPIKASDEFISDMEKIVEGLKQESQELKYEKEKIQEKLERFEKKQSEEWPAEDQISELNFLLSSLKQENENLMQKLESLKNEEKKIQTLANSSKSGPVIVQGLLDENAKLNKNLSKSLSQAQESSNVKLEAMSKTMKDLEDKLKSAEEKETQHKAEVLMKVGKIDEIINEINESPSLFEVTEDHILFDLSKEDHELPPNVLVEEEKENLSYPEVKEKPGKTKSGKKSEPSSKVFEKSVEFKDRKEESYFRSREYKREDRSSEDDEYVNEEEEKVTVTVTETTKTLRRKTVDKGKKSQSPGKEPAGESKSNQTLTEPVVKTRSEGFSPEDTLPALPKADKLIFADVAFQSEFTIKSPSKEKLIFASVGLPLELMARDSKDSQAAADSHIDSRLDQESDEFHDALSDPSIIETFNTDLQSSPVARLERPEQGLDPQTSSLTLVPSSSRPHSGQPGIPGLAPLPAVPSKANPAAGSNPVTDASTSKAPKGKTDSKPPRKPDLPNSAESYPSPDISPIRKNPEAPKAGSSEPQEKESRIRQYRPKSTDSKDNEAKFKEETEGKYEENQLSASSDEEEDKGLAGEDDEDNERYSKNERKEGRGNKEDKGGKEGREGRGDKEDKEGKGDKGGKEGKEGKEDKEAKYSSPVYLRKDRTASIDKETYRKIPGIEAKPQNERNFLLTVNEVKDFEQVSETKVEINEKLDDLVEKLEELKRKCKENEEARSKLKESAGENQKLKDLLDSITMEHQALIQELREKEDENQALMRSKDELEKVLKSNRDEPKQEDFTEQVYEEIEVVKADRFGKSVQSSNERMSIKDSGSDVFNYKFPVSKDPESSESESINSEASLSSDHSSEIQVELSTILPQDITNAKDQKKVNDIKEQLHARLSQKEKELNDLLQTHNELKGDLDKLTSNSTLIEELKQVKEELEGTVHALSEEIKEKEMGIQNLHHKVEDLEQEIKILAGDQNSEIKALADELKRCRDEKDLVQESLNKESIEKDGIVQGLNKAIEENTRKEERLADLVKDKEQNLKDLIELKKEYDDCALKLQLASKDNENLNDFIQKERADSEVLSQSLDRAQSKLQDLEKQRTGLQADVERTQKELENQRLGFEETTKAKQDELEKRKEAYEKELESNKKEIEKLKNCGREAGEENGKLKMEMKMIEGKIDELKAEKENLEQKILESEGENKKIMKGLENDFKSLNETLHSKDQEIENLELKIEALTHDIKNVSKDFENKSESQSSIITKLQEDLDLKENILKKSESDLQSTQEKLSQLEASLSSSQTILELQTGNIEKLESHLKETLEKLEKEKNENQDLAKTLAEEKESIQAVINEKESKLQELTERIHEFQQFEDDLREKTSEFEKQLKDMYIENGGESFPCFEEVEKITSFLKRLATSQDFTLIEIEGKYKELKSVQAELEGSKAALDGANSGCSQLADQLTQKNQELESALRDLEASQERSSALIEEKSKLESSSRSLEDSLSALNDQVSDLQSSLSLANQNLAEKLELISELESSSDSKDLQIDSLKNQVKDLEELAKQQESAIEDLKTSENVSSNNLQVLQKQLNEFSSLINDKEKTISELKHEIESLTALEKNLMEDLNVSKLEIEQQEDEKDKLYNENYNLKEKEKILEHELQKLSSEIASKKTDLAMKDLKIQELEEKEKELEKIQEEHSMSVIEIHNQNSKIREWEVELNELKKKEEKERNLNEKSRVQIFEYEEKIENQKALYDDLSRNIMNEKEKLSSVITGLEKSREDLRQQLKSKEIEVVEGNREKEILLTQINELNVKLAFNDQAETERMFISMKREIMEKDDRIRDLTIQNQLIIAKSRANVKPNLNAQEIEIKRLKNEVEILSFQGLKKNDVIGAMTQEIEGKNLKQMKTNQDLMHLYRLMRNCNEQKVKYLKNYSDNLRQGHNELMQVINEAENKLVHVSHNDMNFVLSMTIMCMLFSLVLALSKKLAS